MDAHAVGVTERGVGRPQNGDAFLVDESLGLFAVADSVGVWDWESPPATEALKRLRPQLAEAGSRGEAPSENLLAEAVLAVNSALLADGRTPEDDQGATTLTCAWLRDDACAIAHVGDSAAFLLHAGEPTRLTPDDSLAGVLLARRLISGEEARKHPGRNQLLNSLGSSFRPSVFTVTIGVGPGDTILLCTDGVARRLDMDTLVHETASARSPFAEVAQRIIALARDRGATDDLTALAVRLEPNGRGEDPKPPDA